MPKHNTNSAPTHRDTRTRAGRVLRRHAIPSHTRETKSAKRRRGFRRDNAVNETDVRDVKRLLGR